MIQTDNNEAVAKKLTLSHLRPTQTRKRRGSRRDLRPTFLLSDYILYGIVHHMVRAESFDKTCARHIRLLSRSSKLFR